MALAPLKPTTVKKPTTAAKKPTGNSASKAPKGAAKSKRTTGTTKAGATAALVAGKRVPPPAAKRLPDAVKANLATVADDKNIKAKDAWSTSPQAIEAQNHLDGIIAGANRTLGLHQQAINELEHLKAIAELSPIRACHLHDRFSNEGSIPSATLAATVKRKVNSDFTVGNKTHTLTAEIEIPQWYKLDQHAIEVGIAQEMGISPEDSFCSACNQIVLRQVKEVYREEHFQTLRRQNPHLSLVKVRKMAHEDIKFVRATSLLSVYCMKSFRRLRERDERSNTSRIDREVLGNIIRANKKAA